MSSEQNNLNKLALKSGTAFVVSNILLKSIAFLTTPIFTRLMTTSEYGTFQTFISWHLLLLPVFSLDLDYSVGRAKLDFPNSLNKYIGSMQVLSGVFSVLLCSIAFFLLCPLSKLLALSISESVLLLLCLMAGPAVLYYQTSYRFQYEYKKNIALAWYIALSSTLLSLVLVITANDNKAYFRMIGVTVPTVLLSIYFWFLSWKRDALNINIEYWKYGLKISLPLIFHIISMHILSHSDRILIAKFCGKADTAFYSLAYIYGAALNILSVAVAHGWSPWFMDTYHEGHFEEIRKNIRPLVEIGCFVSLLCVAIAPETVLFLGGEKYLQSVQCVLPVILGVVCQFIYGNYVRIELYHKKTIHVAYGTVFAAVLNIVLNIVFIPQYGYIAAAYTTLVSYIALLFSHYFITRKILGVVLYDDCFMFGALLATCGIGYVLSLTYNWLLIRYGLIIIGTMVFWDYIRNFGSHLLKFRKRKEEK